MGDRTGPVEALERLSWFLNYHAGETLSLNSISRATGLAWGTVDKYVRIIEYLQRIAPRISKSEEGVKVGRRSLALDGLFADEESALAVYLFVQARQNDSPLEPLDLAEHASSINFQALERMEELGWVEIGDDTVQLTQFGLQIAGPLYSDIQTGEIQKDILRVDRRAGGVRAVIEPAARREERTESPSGKRNFEDQTPVDEEIYQSPQALYA